MYSNNGPYALNIEKVQNEEVKEGNYFIVDWVGNDPVHRGTRYPIVIAGNMTEEQLKMVAEKKIVLEPPRFGTAQRVILKVERVTNI